MLNLHAVISIEEWRGKEGALGNQLSLVFRFWGMIQLVDHLQMVQILMKEDRRLVFVGPIVAVAAVAGFLCLDFSN